MDIDVGTSKSKNKNKRMETPGLPEALKTPDFPEASRISCKTSDLSEDLKIYYKKMYWSSIPGIFVDRLRDFSLAGEDESSSSTTIPSSILDYNKQEFLNFNKFDVVSDYSDHGIGRYMRNKDSKVISKLNRITKRYVLKELQDDLPHTEGIFIRSYQSKPQLLRALIVGAKGTPYQDGLYFFDVFLPCTYPNPDVHPTVRLHSAGFQIHPDIYCCGEVSLSEFTAATLYLKEQGHDTFKILQLLVIIKDVLLNKNPLYHQGNYINSPISPTLEQRSVLYNENVIIKSLKVMIYIMNKPPKHFEAFVVGHFRCHAHDILTACEGYMNGRFLNGELEKRCSIAFKNEVASCIKPLVDAFIRIGSHEAQYFLRLSENKITVPRELGSPDFSSLGATGLTSKEVEVHSTKKARLDNIDTGLQAPRSSMSNNTRIISDLAGLPTLYEEVKSFIKIMMEKNSSAGIFSREDVLVDQNDGDANISIPSSDSMEYVLEKFKSFKRFDTVTDHSDHLFSAPNFEVNQPPEIWVKRIQEEWRILEKDLPDEIFVRVYESRMNILRSVIVGEEETPYHDALFFFDVCLPDTYPCSPPLVRYHSYGLSVNPNVYKCGEVCLSHFKNWVPENSNLLEVLLSIQDLISNAEPFFSGHEYQNMRGSVAGKRCSLLYNENTIVKSLKTMTRIINKPPKNFEVLVHQHFRDHAYEILLACEGYVDNGYLWKSSTSIVFRNDVVSCIKPLVKAFLKVGADKALLFLPLSEKKISSY